MSGWCDHVNTGISIHGKVSKRISRRMGGASRWSCSEKFIAFHLSGILWELGIPPADPCFPRCLHLYSSSSSRFFHSPFPIFQLFPPLHIHMDKDSVGEPQENQRIPRKSQIPLSSWKLSRTAPAGDDFPITTPHINTQAVRQEAFP